MNSTISTHHVQLRPPTTGQENEAMMTGAHNANDSMTSSHCSSPFSPQTTNMMAAPMPDFDSDFERMFMMLQEQRCQQEQQQQQQQQQQTLQQRGCGFFNDASNTTCHNRQSVTINNNWNINEMPLLPQPMTLPNNKRRRLNNNEDSSLPSFVSTNNRSMGNPQPTPALNSITTPNNTTTIIPTVEVDDDAPSSFSSSIEVAAIPTVAEVVTTVNDDDIPLVEAIPITATTPSSSEEESCIKRKRRVSTKSTFFDTSAMDYLPGQDVKLTNLTEPFKLFNGMIGMIHERRTNGKIIIRVVDEDVDNLLLGAGSEGTSSTDVDSSENDDSDKPERRPLFLAVRSHNLICMAQTQLIG